MQIKGLQKLTLIDYPQKIACTVFLAGCNFRCPWCYSPELVLPERIKEMPDVKKEDFFQFLDERKGKIEGVVICGGEPTISKELPEFAREIKEKGFLVKLDTNGSNPKALKGIIKAGYVDFIAMDVKVPLERYTEVEGLNAKKEDIKESIEIIKGSGVEYEFRTTVVPGVHEEEDIMRIAKEIAPADNYFLQNFLPEKTLKKNFLHKNPFSKEQMEGFKEAARQYVKTCQVR